MLEEAVALLRHSVPPSPNLLIDCLVDLASAHAELRVDGEVRVVLDDAIGVLRKSDPPRRDLLATCLQRLAGTAPRGGGEAGPAPDRSEEACEIWRNVEPSRPSDRAGRLVGLSWVYRRTGDGDEARRVLAEANGVASRVRRQAADLRDRAEYLKALPPMQESAEMAHILFPAGMPRSRHA